jgi:hypothetical protein
MDVRTLRLLPLRWEQRHLERQENLAGYQTTNTALAANAAVEKKARLMSPL